MRTTSRHIIKLLLKTETKENILEVARENNILEKMMKIIILREKWWKLSQIFHQKLWKKDKNGITSLKCKKKKKLSTQNPIANENIFQE